MVFQLSRAGGGINLAFIIGPIVGLIALIALGILLAFFMVSQMLSS